MRPSQDADLFRSIAGDNHSLGVDLRKAEGGSQFFLIYHPKRTRGTSPGVVDHIESFVTNRE